MRDSSTRFEAFDLGDGNLSDDEMPDVEMEVAEHQATVVTSQDVAQPDANVTSRAGQETASEKLIIGVDFGTTFSSVAYVRLHEITDPESLDLEDIRCIKNYPHDPLMQMSRNSWERREDVPTELWYDIELPKARLRRSKRPGGQIEIPAEVRDDAAAASDSDDNSRPSFMARSDDEDVVPTIEREQVIHATNIETADRVVWGFAVQARLQDIDLPKDGSRRISNFKLMLDDSDDTKDIRKNVGETTTRLKALRFIKNDTDVIVEFLERLLGHTKKELERTNEWYPKIPIEFVLCVPAVWPSKSCRQMQSFLARAAFRAGLVEDEKRCLHNLFIMSEPEAAANCVMAEDASDIFPGDTIVIIDAGGGTVDAATYRVDNMFPLTLNSLKEEVVQTATKLCGGSYVNKHLQEMLCYKLRHETYLEGNHKTIENIAQAKVLEFENKEKRFADPRDPGYTPGRVDIPYLKADSRKRFVANRLILRTKDIADIFKKSLDESETLLREQLELAAEKQMSIQKVILVGGFGRSPALQSRLRAFLKEETNVDGQEIKLVPTRTSTSTAVARGAVLRALNKAYGPERISLCSYGFLRTEHYEPEGVPAHRGKKPTTDPVDGEKYIENTIEWLINKGQKLDTKHVERIKQRHTFRAPRHTLICKEVLYMSDKARESHYRKSHVNNMGAEVAGSIVADMSFLLRRKLIQPQTRPDVNGKKAHPYYVVEFDLLMIVDGRNLRYEVRWSPPTLDGEPAQHETVVADQICIAANFVPGTA